MKDGVHLILSDARGVYIPRDFVSNDHGQTVDSDTCAKWGIKPDDAAILAAGPDTEWYWDTWHDVLNYAKCDVGGFVFTLLHDGDLWALCPELMSNEEKIRFGFDEDLCNYVVLLRESGASALTEPIGFQCEAEDADHAEEQAENAYPNCDIVWVWQGSAGSGVRPALEDYYSSSLTN